MLRFACLLIATCTCNGQIKSHCEAPGFWFEKQNKTCSHVYYCLKKAIDSIFTAVNFFFYRLICGGCNWSIGGLGPTMSRFNHHCNNITCNFVLLREITKFNNSYRKESNSTGMQIILYAL